MASMDAIIFWNSAWGRGRHWRDLLVVPMPRKKPQHSSGADLELVTSFDELDSSGSARHPDDSVTRHGVTTGQRPALLFARKEIADERGLNAVHSNLLPLCRLRFRLLDKLCIKSAQAACYNCCLSILI